MSLTPYPRILLKLSGEAFAGSSEFGIDTSVLDRMAADIAAARAVGAQVGVVIGGGNLFRGAALQAAGLDRVTGDHMGMLATVMNALALADALRRIDVPQRVFSAVPMTGIADAYDRRHAQAALAEGTVVLLSGGTGNPLFTTDTAACLRGIEVHAQLVLKATKVDGVYSADPKRDASARRFDCLSYDAVLARNLAVMDLSAIVLCRDHGLPLRVFDMAAVDGLRRIVQGESLGTLVNASGRLPAGLSPEAS